MYFGKKFLVQALEELDRENGGDVMTVIIVRHGDPFDSASLGSCPDCPIPGLPHGQKADWRIAADNGRGLHGYVYDDRVEFHLDAVDACRDAVGHLFKDTKAFEGAALGALAGAAVALVSGKASVVAGAAVGAIGGVVAGAYLPAREKKTVEFRDLISHLPAFGRQEGRYGWPA